MNANYLNAADPSFQAQDNVSEELNIDDLTAVNGGGFGDAVAGAVVGWFVEKVLDAAWEGLKNAGPAPATEHGSIYTVQPGGFVG